MNTITLAGKIVGRDAQKKDVGTDGLVSFSVGDSRKVKGEWQTTFFDVAIWGKLGDALLPSLTKGTNVTVVGELQAPVVKGEKCYLSIKCNSIHIARESVATEELPF